VIQNCLDPMPHRTKIPCRDEKDWGKNMRCTRGQKVVMRFTGETALHKNQPSAPVCSPCQFLWCQRCHRGGFHSTQAKPGRVVQNGSAHHRTGGCPSVTQGLEIGKMGRRASEERDTGRCEEGFQRRGYSAPICSPWDSQRGLYDLVTPCANASSQTYSKTLPWPCGPGSCRSVPTHAPLTPWAPGLDWAPVLPSPELAVPMYLWPPAVGPVWSLLPGPSTSITVALSSITLAQKSLC
jgi:hypothetical protein